MHLFTTSLTQFHNFNINRNHIPWNQKQFYRQCDLFPNFIIGSQCSQQILKTVTSVWDHRINAAKIDSIHCLNLQIPSSVNLHSPIQLSLFIPL